MKIKNIASALAVTLAIVIGVQTTAFAAVSYNDVPPTHWAYAAIIDMANRGLIVGDTNGNYNPDAFFSKFDAAKIFAKMAGYKYTGLTADEQANYNAIYARYQSFLAQYSTKFTKWDSLSNREISFLLDKGILTEADLNQFVIIDANGNELVRPLSKEECVVFLTRLLGGEATAAAMPTPINKFADDASISASTRSDVYYLRSLGIVSGDADNNFNPKSSITKAMLASVLYRAYSLGIDFTAQASAPSPTTTQATPAPTPTPTQAAGTTVNISSVSGTIVQVYTNVSQNYLSIMPATGAAGIYKAAPDAAVYINGVAKTFGDLQVGMSVAAVLNNGYLTEIRCVTQATPVPTQASPVPTASPGSTPSATTTQAGSSSSALATIEGVVSNADAINNQISVTVQILNPRGQVISNDYTYSLAPDCAITRGGSATTFDDISVGDIVSAQVAGTVAFSIDLEQKDITITAGTLMDKALNSLNQPVLTIENADGDDYTFKVTADTKLTRNGDATVTWDQLRIGDTVDAVCEYDQILSLTATGVVTTTQGTVEEIYLSRAQSYFVINDYNNKIQKYYLMPGVDPYGVCIGDTVQLRLDSREISVLKVLAQSAGASITGTIKAVNTAASSVTVTNVSAGGSVNTDVFYDANTIVIDASTGNRITARNLTVGQTVYVVFGNAGSNVAKTITVLN